MRWSEWGEPAAARAEHRAVEARALLARVVNVALDLVEPTRRISRPVLVFIMIIRFNSTIMIMIAIMAQKTQ